MYRSQCLIACGRLGRSLAQVRYFPGGSDIGGNVVTVYRRY